MIQQKLFLDLYLAKFLDTSAKPFFPCLYNFATVFLNYLFANRVYFIRNDCEKRGSVYVVLVDNEAAL